MSQTSFRFNPGEQARARDSALDLIEAHRADLVGLSRFVAVELCQRNGSVTGPDVFAELHERGLSELLKHKDPRFMGAVFRKGWIRIGQTNSGSHRRPVSIWALRRAA
jgi:hypothetical protein